MTQSTGYVLGQSERAARRLAIQDAHFGTISERLLDELALPPTARVVEMGCGAGSFSRRILSRLGAGGVVVGVDCSEGLLTQARTQLTGISQARFEAVSADISQLGSWLDGADAVVGRTVLHHVPMVEFMLGRLRSRLAPGTRLGFLEPDFRSPLARLTDLETNGRPELAPLRIWARAINHLYLAIQISPDVGASLGQTLKLAGYQNVQQDWMETHTDAMTLENMIMFYDEVRERLESLGIMNSQEIAEQQSLLKSLPSSGLPGVWGIYRVTAVV